MKPFVTKVNFTTISIFFNGLLFVMMKRREFIGATSWMEGGDKYCVAFILKHGEIKVELDSRKKWVALLKEADRSLGKE